MKKLVVILVAIILVLIPDKVLATEESEIDTNSIINSQLETLNIASLIKEAKSYKTDVLDDLDIYQILTDALKGKIDTKTLGNNILNTFTKNIFSTITSIASIIIIVIIHSVLKSLTDDLENTSTSQITYYVTCILIVTIVMKNFADTITMIKGSIENLVGFTNCLLPILITLMLTTRKYSIEYNARANNIICNNFNR